MSGSPENIQITLTAVAHAVSLAERRSATSATSAILDLCPSKGRCSGAPPRYCVIGRLRPGERATVSVTIRARVAGRFTNVVAVNTRTHQRTGRGKVARAIVVAVPQAQPRFTGYRGLRSPSPQTAGM